MYILGIYNGHNATACLMRDGQVLAVASEERFTGIKNFIGFPKNAIDYVLKEGGITSKDLDQLCLPFKYGAPIWASQGTKRSLAVRLFVYLYKPVNFVRFLWGKLAYYLPAIRPFGRLLYVILASTVGSFTVSREKQFIARYLGIDKGKIISFDHHLSHGASAYYASPFNNKKVLVLTADGEGDTYSASVCIFDKDQIKVISRTPREDSLGYMYAGLTTCLGMKANEHEYKVMGLAPYAKPQDVDRIYESVKNFIRVDKEGLLFKTKINTQNMEQYLRDNFAHVRFDILAGVFQKLLEEKLVEWARAAVEKTGIRTVVFAGGTFMNVKANQKIAQLPEIKEYFVIPSAGDESSVLGAAYLGYVKNMNGGYQGIPAIKDIYWGAQFSDQQIKTLIRKNGVYRKYRVRKVAGIEKEIARLLAKGEVVARLSGRMEFGARALGNRSILADPRNPEIVRVINEQVKNRDFWMPFAPSLLYERHRDYIRNPKNLSAYYMMITFDTTLLAKRELRAAMHPYDFTVRPQLVREEYNPKYYRILKEFERMTGVGGVLNTSFNLHGFPIVLGPKEALDAFGDSGLKYLVLENYLISKRPRRGKRLKD